MKIEEAMKNIKKIKELREEIKRIANLIPKNLKVKPDATMGELMEFAMNLGQVHEIYHEKDIKRNQPFGYVQYKAKDWHNNILSIAWQAHSHNVDINTLQVDMTSLLKDVLRNLRSEDNDLFCIEVTDIKMLIKFLRKFTTCKDKEKLKILKVLGKFDKELKELSKLEISSEDHIDDISSEIQLVERRLDMLQLS